MMLMRIYLWRRGLFNSSSKVLKTNAKKKARVLLLGHAGTFWLYGLIAIGAWIFFYRLVPETKGKSLEQIEAHWRSGKSPLQL